MSWGTKKSQSLFSESLVWFHLTKIPGSTHRTCMVMPLEFGNIPGQFDNPDNTDYIIKKALSPGPVPDL